MLGSGVNIKFADVSFAGNVGMESDGIYSFREKTGEYHLTFTGLPFTVPPIVVATLNNRTNGLLLTVTDVSIRGATIIITNDSSFYVIAVAPIWL